MLTKGQYEDAKRNYYQTLACAYLWIIFDVPSGPYDGWQYALTVVVWLTLGYLWIDSRRLLKKNGLLNWIGVKKYPEE